MNESLIYEDHPRYALWIKLILGGVLLLTLALGIYFLSIDRMGAYIMFGLTLIDALLFFFLMPRSYQIYSDRLVVILGGPFTKTVPLYDIRSARKVSGSHAFINTGFRFAVSAKYVVEIARRTGTNITISPNTGDLFLEQLNQTMKQFASTDN